MSARRLCSTKMLEGLFDSSVNLTIIALFGAMIFVGRLAACGGYCPKLLFLRRWLGVLFYSFSGAACLEFFGLERDFGVLLFCGAALYFLVITAYSWIVICSENFGEDIPPRFDPVDDAWMDSPKYADLMRRIEAAGYKKSGSFEMNDRSGARTVAARDNVRRRKRAPLRNISVRRRFDDGCFG